MKKSFVCSGFGHREVFNDIDNKLSSAIEFVINEGCNEFLTGDMGEFDKRFIRAVIRAKKVHSKIKLKLVIPYFSEKLNKMKEYYDETFDEIILPDEVANVHYKGAIKERNKWMVEESDFVIAYIYRDFGRAYAALKHAQKKDKIIVCI